MSDEPRSDEPLSGPGATTGPSPVAAARLLLRAAHAGSLATVTDGQPFNSLATPAPAPDGSILLLLSELSEHTRHLRREPRCALLVTAAPDGPNPQTSPRLTVTGLASLEPDPAMKRRWIARHPYAAFYAGFGDFHLWRIQPMGGQYIGGFASATRLRQADLQPDPAAVASILAAEDGILAHCNQDHGDALDAIAAHHGAGSGATGWQMTACDVDGCDLTHDEMVLRIPWSAPVQNAGGVRSELVMLARAARNTAETPAGRAV